MAVCNLQILDVHGLNLIIQKLKDGTLVVGKAGSVDAAQISGTIPLDKLPKAALERIVIVETEAARLALTSIYRTETASRSHKQAKCMPL